MLNTDDWVKVANAEVQYVQALAAYRLQSAQAEVALAQAAHERAATEETLVRLSMKKDLAAQIRREFAELNRAAYKLRRQAALAKSMSGKLGNLKQGRHVTAQGARLGWQAMHFFLNRIGADSIAKMMADLPADAKTAGNYEMPFGVVGRAEAVPDHVHTAMGMAAFMEERGYVAKLGGPAFMVLIGLLEALCEPARVQLKVLNDSMQAMKEGTYRAAEKLGMLIVGRGEADG